MISSFWFSVKAVTVFFLLAFWVGVVSSASSASSGAGSSWTGSGSGGGAALPFPFLPLVPLGGSSKRLQKY